MPTGQITQAVDNNEARKKPSARQVVRDLLDRNVDALRLSLPKAMDADRFARLLLTAANTNPTLFECSPSSFLAAGVACAQLGLEPNDARGLAYLIPFKDKRRGLIVQVIIGYRGMMDLARRSGMVTSIHSIPVYKGDDFDYTLGLYPTLKHVPGDHDEKAEDLTHVYAVAKIAGDPQFVVLTRRQVDKAKAQSTAAASGKSPWQTHYVEMAQKTAVRRLCKYLPQTVEVAQALDSEERPLTLTDLGHIEYEPADHDDAIDANAIEAGADTSSSDPAATSPGAGTTKGAE